jgi:hypothetical protein
LIGLKSISFIIWNGRLTFRKDESREGTVVDADDLMQEMTETAQKNCGRFREVRYLFR